MDKHVIKSRKLRRFIKNRLAVIGLGIVALIVLLAVLAPVITPYNPLQHDYDELLLSPSFKHLMGTDDLGRDIFVLETVIMRGVDTVLAIPTLILAIAIAGAFGGGLWVMIISIAVAGWGEFTRLVRAQVLSLKELTYVEAARAIGAGQARIIFKHIVPNSMGPVLVYTSLYMPTAILWSAALSFLGLGAQPPTPEWGAIIADGRAFISYAWWIATFPGLAIMVTTLGFNFVGDGLRDALDPKFERRT